MPAGLGFPCEYAFKRGEPKTGFLTEIGKEARSLGDPIQKKDSGAGGIIAAPLILMEGKSSKK